MSRFLKIFAPALSGTGAVLTGAYFLADQFVVEIPAPMRGTLVQPVQAQETAATETEGETDDAMVTETAHSVLTAPEGGYGLGRAALDEEIAAWDIDVRPDGLGLPVGSGDVWTGEEVYIENCAMCHGDFGEAVGRWPVLAGGHDTLSREDPVKTIGSYWPYLSTVYDYINRAMPFGNAQSLEPDEVYAITAYLLYMNDIVDDDFELSNENFLTVEMPNAENFYMDDRLEVEFPLFTQEPCMSDCKEAVEITMHASVLDVTPDDETATEEAAMSEDHGDVAEEALEVAEANEEMVEEAVAGEELGVQEAAVAAVSPELIAEGEGVFRQCRSCHAVGEGARNGAGPHLNGIIGRTAGVLDGFRYSGPMVEAGESGLVWDAEAVAAFVADPRGYMNGTRMSFRGLRDEAEIAALIAYLGTLEE